MTEKGAQSALLLQQTSRRTRSGSCVGKLHVECVITFVSHDQHWHGSQWLGCCTCYFMSFVRPFQFKVGLLVTKSHATTISYLLPLPLHRQVSFDNVQLNFREICGFKPSSTLGKLNQTLISTHFAFQSHRDPTVYLYLTVIIKQIMFNATKMHRNIFIYILTKTQQAHE